MIEIKNVTKIYKSKKGVNTTALSNINLMLPDKGMVFIVGKSGSGKSTFLNVLAGLDKYNAGEIIVNGKSFNKFKNKDYDIYRNTYVGFIFQEFNLLDEYNVYENIELSMNLQKKKASKDLIDNVLSEVGLSNIGKRKTNELSGGQKQRVSIARALIKSPKIILADEPTGSLDSKTSEQIFNLLKDISKDKLVVVVSHDLESAKIYADRIIHFSDGKVIQDLEKEHSEYTSSHWDYIKSKLPTFSALKLALANLSKKKLRLFFTIILTTFALSFFGVANMLSHYNLAYSHARTMVEENESLIGINKNYVQEDGSYQVTSKLFMPFTDSEINYLESALNRDTIKVTSLYENGKSVQFNIPSNISSQTPVYYTYLFTKPYFIELNNANEFNLKIIGNFPTNYDEIVIHKYIADYIIQNGIYLYLDKSIEENKLKEPELYKPTSYEQLVEDGKYVQLGTNKVKIVGIVDEDMSKYDILKNINYADITNENEKLVNTFADRFTDKINKIYVKKGFLDNISLNPNITIDSDEFLFSYSTSNKDIPINSTISKMSNEIIIFNGDEELKTTQLNNDEIIINKEYLNAITDDNFNQQLSEYLKENISKSDLTEEEMEKEYILSYLKTNNIIGSTLDLKVTDFNKKVNTDIETQIENVKIVGYTTEDTIYLSNNLLDKYMYPKYEINKLYFFENNENKMEEIFTEIPLNHSKFTTETVFSNNIISIENTLNTVSQVALYASIIFFIFAMILLINFVSSTISSNKKQIGILRALGTRKKDVFKVFLFEGMFIGLVSLVLALAICYICCNVGNTIFINEFLFSIKPIIFTSSVVLTLIVSVVIIVMLSSIITSYKISSMKPIDAIYEK